MYEMFKGLIDVAFFAAAIIAIIGAVVKMVKSKKK